jgi:hypothetical protein
MPIQTKVLDNGNFVCSPEHPARPAFSDYLNFADRLLGQWRKAQEAWNQSPFSADLQQQKSELDKAVAGFVESFKTRYTLARVEQDPAFLPVAQFFARFRPIREPFSILHCDGTMPLHTVLAFETHRDLAQLNAALEEDTPLRWWQKGPHDRPCYLFGQWVWELRPSEVALSEEAVVLLFLDVSDKQRQRQDRLTQRSWGPGSAAPADYIPEKARVAVWRRAGGKCEKCGAKQGLDFYGTAPATNLRSVPGGATLGPESIQMLCARCSGARAT